MVHWLVFPLQNCDSAPYRISRTPTIRASGPILSFRTIHPGHHSQFQAIHVLPQHGLGASESESCLCGRNATLLLHAIYGRLRLEDDCRLLHFDPASGHHRGKHHANVALHHVASVLEARPGRESI